MVDEEVDEGGGGAVGLLDAGGEGAVEMVPEDVAGLS